MSSKRFNRGTKDYISGLPDCLICHILSFLATKEAASTSVLAKRWRHLFALTPNLDFNDSVYLIPENANLRKSFSPWTTREKMIPRSFVYFVDRVLVLHHNVTLNRFSLKCECVFHPAIVIGWLLKVLEHGVLDLDLNLSTALRFPSEMCVNETLVRLKLGLRDNLIFNNVEDFFLPNVKTLCLNDVAMINYVFAKLLSGCHALEELVLDDFKIVVFENSLEVKGYCSVSHNTLKRLVVRSSRTLDENQESVSFSTPNLVYLEYSDTIANIYPKVEFNSLVEASIDLRMTSNQIVNAISNDGSTSEEMVGNATKFLMGISNVKILHLSCRTLLVLAYCCKPRPQFNNLIHLTIQTDLYATWESLPGLLKNCPKLETLVFEGLHYGDRNRTPWEGTCEWLSSSPVKKLKVLKFGDMSYYNDDMVMQMDMIKYFVETMPNLEEVVLYYETRGEDDLKIVSAAFQMLEKVASTKCKIQVISDEITLSSIVCSTSSTAGLL